MTNLKGHLKFMLTEILNFSLPKYFQYFFNKSFFLLEQLNYINNSFNRRIPIEISLFNLKLLLLDPYLWSYLFDIPCS